MKIRVLGCHGSDQVLNGSRGAHQCRTCAFLVNETVLVDAGTVGTALRLDEQKRIRHILLSHLHHDHIQGLPTLADNLVDAPDEPVTLTSIPSVLKGLQTHVFNDKVYPNFLKLPDPRHPVFVCRSLKPGKESELDGLRVTAIPVNHLVPTVGFLIRGAHRDLIPGYHGGAGSYQQTPDAVRLRSRVSQDRPARPAGLCVPSQTAGP